MLVIGRGFPSAVSVLIALTLAMQACVSVPPRSAVPEELVEKATVLGEPVVRFWGDELPADLSERLGILKRQLAASGDKSVSTRPRYYLSISGGGANGAFGAGLLKGWTESGTRPEMTIVTGISTGALVAPFAFLGSGYDEKLEELYTTITTKDLIKKRSLIAGLTSDALSDTGPFRELLKEHVDQEMVTNIAQEYAKGRRLLIGTTNLDAKRPVVWNIGAIAAIGTEEATQLIRDVMLASASIPGMFSPVRIAVRVGDEEYDELHADGGVSSQVFLYPAQFDAEKAAKTVGISTDQRVYVIRNSILDPRWSEVEPKVAEVAAVSISTLIRTQGMGDLYRIYLGATRDEMLYRLAYIPSDFDLEPAEAFDPKYMRALFDLAYELSRDGYDWATSPPGIVLP